MRRRELPQEPELIPFEAGFPPGQRWLFLAAHPDDETFGPGSTLAQARSRGVEITVVVVTDGRVQGDPAARAGEVRLACAELGLEHVELWGFADRTLRPEDRNLQARIAGALDATRAELVLVPAPVDLNIDHRALALASLRVIRRRTRLGLRRAFPEWVAAYEVGAPIVPNLLVAGDPGWERKLAAAACYETQEVHRPYREAMDALGVVRRITLRGCTRAEAIHLLPSRSLARLSVRAWASLMGSPEMVRTRPGSALSP